MREVWLFTSSLLWVAIALHPVTALSQDNARPSEEKTPAADKDKNPSAAKQESGAEESAQDDSGKAEEIVWEDLTAEDAAAKVEEWNKSFTERLTEYRKAFQAASAEEKAGMRGKMPQAKEYFPNLQKIAELFPKTEAAGKALLWIVQHVRSGEDYDQALSTLVEFHSDLPELRPVVAAMQFQPPSAKTTGDFERLVQNCPNKDLVAVGNYAFLQYQKRLERTQTVFAENPERAEAFAKSYGEEQLEYLKNFKPISEEERIAALEKIAAESGDVELSPGRKLADVVEGEIFETKYLKIGLEAPDIEGEDIDGVAFKLSDYRGKVVVIDFWGDW